MEIDSILVCQPKPIREKILFVIMIKSTGKPGMIFRKDT